MSSHWPTSVKLINCPREAAAEAVCVSQPAILITAKSVTCSQADKVHTGCFEALHNRLWSFAAASSSPPFSAPLSPLFSSSPLSPHQIALLIHLIYLLSTSRSPWTLMRWMPREDRWMASWLVTYHQYHHSRYNQKTTTTNTKTLTICSSSICWASKLNGSR